MFLYRMVEEKELEVWSLSMNASLASLITLIGLAWNQAGSISDFLQRHEITRLTRKCNFHRKNPGFRLIVNHLVFVNARGNYKKAAASSIQNPVPPIVVLVPVNVAGSPYS